MQNASKRETVSVDVVGITLGLKRLGPNSIELATNVSSAHCAAKHEPLLLVRSLALSDLSDPSVTICCCWC